jgi:hypothetical protein
MLFETSGLRNSTATGSVPFFLPNLVTAPTPRTQQPQNTAKAHHIIKQHNECNSKKISEAKTFKYRRW